MISWPGGASASDAVDPSGAMLVPAPKVAKKASGLPRQPPSSAGGGKKKDQEKYSMSYSSISLVPDSWIC